MYSITLRNKLETFKQRFLFLQSVGRDVPDLDVFSRYVSKSYTPEMLIKDEQTLLRVLRGELNAPSTLQALRYYARILDLDPEVFARAHYYLDVSLYFLSFCRQSDSQLAAAALLLALRTSKVGDWVRFFLLFVSSSSLIRDDF